jgi:flavin reductase (DIM6/NTAB) family NADH-FMN oxidoreductase RutF
MNQNWKTVKPEELKDNPFDLLGKKWMLVTAGTVEKWNTMTASWGCLGVLWNKPVAVCFVRPTRHTFAFMDKAEYFSLSFFAEEHREILNFCGANSGRTTDKAAATGLVPENLDGKAVTFEQARMVLLCRKLYSQDLDPKFFLDPSIDHHYPAKDYHRIFLGEVERCLRREP